MEIALLKSRISAPVILERLPPDAPGTSRAGPGGGTVCAPASDPLGPTAGTKTRPYGLLIPRKAPERGRVSSSARHVVVITYGPKVGIGGPRVVDGKAQIRSGTKNHSGLTKHPVIPRGPDQGKAVGRALEGKMAPPCGNSFSNTYGNRLRSRVQGKTGDLPASGGTDVSDLEFRRFFPRPRITIMGAHDPVADGGPTSAR